MNKKLKLFISTLLNIKSESEMENFLKGMLTFKELDEIPTRLEIVRMLKKGVPQQKIANQLGVGIATVTRGSKELKIGRFKNI